MPYDLDQFITDCRKSLERDPGPAGREEVRKGLERLLEGRHRLAERTAFGGPGAGLLAVGHGLGPHFATQGVVRQVFDLLSPLLGCQRLERFDNACVQHAPPLQQQAAVGHLVREGMLEGVLALGKEPRLVEKLGRLEVCQAAMQRVLGQLGKSLEQGEGHLSANDRSGLEQALFLCW